MNWLLGLQKLLFQLIFFQQIKSTQLMLNRMLDRGKSFGRIFFLVQDMINGRLEGSGVHSLTFFFTYRALVDFRMHSRNAYLLHSKSLGQSSALFSLIKA